LNVGLCQETLGRISLEAGSYEQARIAFHVASSLLEPNTRPWARVQTYLGQTEYLLGNLDLASAAYGKALSFFQGRKISDYTNEAALRFGLGKLALRRGQLDEAGAQLQRSIDLTNLLRENASSDDFRSSFLDSVHNRYEAYVELLMTRDSKEPGHGLNIRAFEASESGRARALLDSLRNYQKELRQPSDPLLLREEKKLQKEEQTLVDARTKLVSEGASKQTRDELDAKLAEVRAKYESLQARIKSDPKFINFLRPAPLSYQTIQEQVTAANISLLTYSLGDTKSFAWVITPEGLSSFELSDRRSINDAADRMLNLLKSPATTDDQQTQQQSAIDQVSTLVLQPVAAKLRGSRLVVVADGLLQYIPFQILKSTASGNDSLISTFDVIGAPSASALAVARQERINRQPGAKLVVGFGDSVFSFDYVPPGPGTTSADSTTSRSEGISRLRKLPRLFHAQRELRAIRDVAGDDSEFYTEYAATRYNLMHVDLAQFRILHVVTHGVLDTDEPELSGLVLSMVDENKEPIDGFVSLADIYRLRAPVDLVVLSACQTAVGRGLRGEGLIGLTRGFMYAGASGVVASLWKVDDKVTAQLMRYFYANMLQGGMTPAAALRAAQNTIRSQPQWSSPYYWAGFTFHGDYDLTINGNTAAAHRTYNKLIGVVTLSAVLLVVLYWYLRRRRVGVINKR
jgi:CHAT domain-containing protein